MIRASRVRSTSSSCADRPARSCRPGATAALSWRNGPRGSPRGFVPEHGWGPSMLTMAVGHSDDVDAGDAIAEVIAACRTQLGDAVPKAGLLVSSFDTFDRSILGTVTAPFPTAQTAGGTSAAELSSV